jgi:transcriptional regulator with XRE-family HTH domain
MPVPGGIFRHLEVDRVSLGSISIKENIRSIFEIKRLLEPIDSIKNILYNNSLMDKGIDQICSTIKALRTTHGIKQKEIAELIGITQSAYSLIEAGINKPTIAILLKLSEIFKVKPSHIIDGVGLSFGKDTKDVDLMFDYMAENKALRYQILGFFFEKKGLLDNDIKTKAST